MNAAGTELVALLLAPPCLMLLLGFLGRSVIKQFLDRNLEAHKAALCTSSEREIERFKEELRRANYEHSVLFAKLHAERARALKLLYQKVLVLGRAARMFLRPPANDAIEDFATRQMKLEQHLQTVADQLFESRIFLPEDLCVQVDNLIREVQGCAMEVSAAIITPGDAGKKLAAVLHRETALNESTWKLEAEVSRQFRKLLGVP